MRRKPGFMVKFSYFVASMIVIAGAYLYTDELAAWAFAQMTEFMNHQLGMLGI